MSASKVSCHGSTKPLPNSSPTTPQSFENCNATIDEALNPNYLWVLKASRRSLLLHLNKRLRTTPQRERLVLKTVLNGLPTSFLRVVIATELL